MHYIDFDSKTRRTIVHFATYLTVGLFALGLSIIILMAARGYDVDPSTGHVIRNGLILVWSQPGSADLYLDGELEDDTPARLPLPTGSYDVELVREGYQNWKKTISVYGSEVVKVNYPRMFPDEIVAEQFASVPSVSYWSQSPSQELMLTHSNDKPRALNLYDIKDEISIPRTITVPTAKLNKFVAGSSKITPTQWSADSKYILVKHDNGSLVEFVRVAVEEDEVININTSISKQVSDVQFDRSENDIMYGKAKNGLLVRFNVKNSTVSDGLAADITKYRVASDGRVVAVQERSKKSFVLVIDGENVESIYSGTVSGPKVQLELGNFEGDHYAIFSVSPNEAKIVWLDNLPGYDDKMLATLSGKDIVVHPVSFTARFAMVSTGDQIITHDFDKFRVHQFRTKGMNPKTISWFDDGHVVAVAGGKIIIREFDGANMTEIGQASNFDVFAGAGFENFYSLKKAEDGSFSFNSSNLEVVGN